MGYQLESFAELYVEGTEQVENVHGLMVGEWADVGMYIGAGTSMPGWWTVIASVLLLVILVKGNTDEQDHYK
jgi:hypothetical protein|tara:strand:+ start:282 stop:497 length:216 start_codon:yes stop_codon:yes gene_type:complete